MDSDDCILNVKIIYKEKSFNISSENIITIDEIKEAAKKNFNIKDKDKNNIKLFVKTGEKDLFITSEDDIIQNADDSDINNPKLDINLLIESKEENISKEDTDISLSEQINENTSKTNNISEEKLVEIKNENEIKYKEVKSLIEKLSNEIKILKEDQINKHKILENNNLNIKNEIVEYKKKIEIINSNNIKLIEENDKLKIMIREEFKKINEEINNKFRNMEELFQKREKEIIDFKKQIIESYEKNVKEFKLNSENKKNVINSGDSEKILNLQKSKIDEKINNLENKYNDMINSSVKELENKIEVQNNNTIILQGVIQELIKKTNDNEKEIKFFKDSSINFKNINKTNKNIIIDESYNESNNNNNNVNNIYNINQINQNFNMITNDNKSNNSNEFSLLNSFKKDSNASINFNNQEKADNQKLNNNETNLNSKNEQKNMIDQKQVEDKIKELRNKYKEELKDISDEKLQEMLHECNGGESKFLIDLILNKTRIGL